MAKIIEYLKNKKRETLAAIKGVALGLVLIAGASSFYTVDQTQQAVITQFGKPKRVILNVIEGEDKQRIIESMEENYKKDGVSVSEGAGLRLKVPFIQTVKKYDRRLLRWNGYPEQIPTKDKKYIWVDTTTRFYIQDPLKFLKSVGTEEGAHARLDDVIDSTVRNSITSRNLIEIVRTDNREMKVAEEELKETIKIKNVYEGRPDIVAEITKLSKKVCEEWGIGIHDCGVLIKGLNYVEDVKTKVEDRMIEERLRIAKKYDSEGNGEYERIMGDKERDLKVILSGAYKEAEIIKGAADANAVNIYANAFSKDPDFYKFCRTLELYENSFNGKTRLILGTDNPLFELIKGNIYKKESKNQETKN